MEDCKSYNMDDMAEAEEEEEVHADMTPSPEATNKAATWAKSTVKRYSLGSVPWVLSCERERGQRPAPPIAPSIRRLRCASSNGGA